MPALRHKGKIGQFLKRSASEATQQSRQRAAAARAARGKPPMATRQQQWLWLVLLAFLSGSLYVLHVQRVTTDTLMYRGAAAGFRDDGALREFGDGEATWDSTCDDIASANWRLEILRFAARGGIVAAGDVYVFGVTNGRSVKLLRQIFPSSPTWGFDSFEGLPEEAEPTPGPMIEAHKAGAYRTAHSAETLRDSIYTDERELERKWSGKKREKELELRQSLVPWGGMVMPSGGLEFEEGWWEDVLDDFIASNSGMAPAAYIDMDANLYSSAFLALDWMFSKGLVQAGTLIGYQVSA